MDAAMPTWSIGYIHRDVCVLHWTAATSHRREGQAAAHVTYTTAGRSLSITSSPSPCGEIDRWPVGLVYLARSRRLRASCATKRTTGVGIDASSTRPFRGGMARVEGAFCLRRRQCCNNQRADNDAAILRQIRSTKPVFDALRLRLPFRHYESVVKWPFCR